MTAPLGEDIERVAEAIRERRARSGAPRPRSGRSRERPRRSTPLVEELCGDLGTIRAPRGTELNARSWLTEAPLRMLLNNLDREVAERPEELVVYGGSGKAARSHAALERSSARCSSWARTRRCSSRAASPSGSSARTATRRAS